MTSSHAAIESFSPTLDFTCIHLSVKKTQNSPANMPPPLIGSQKLAFDQIGKIDTLVFHSKVQWDR